MTIMLNQSQLLTILVIAVILIALFLVYVIIRSKRIRERTVEDPLFSSIEVVQMIRSANEAFNDNLYFNLTVDTVDKVAIREGFHIHFFKPCALQSEYPIKNSYYSRFYFEIKIKSISEDTIIILGLAPKDNTCSTFPGEKEKSVGYCSISGNIQMFSGRQYKDVKYGQPLKAGDILGIGYQNYTRQIYFTRNGSLFRPLKFPLNTKPIDDLYPTIYANGRCHLIFNNGSQSFAYFLNNVEQAFSLDSLPSPPPYTSNSSPNSPPAY